MWDDHDRQLDKERTVCIAPGCQCRMQVDMMLRTFDEEMERVDSVSARFPDRHVRKYVIRFNDGSSDDEVPGISTPPIRRRRCRKYATWRTILVVAMKRNIGLIEVIHGISIC